MLFILLKTLLVLCKFDSILVLVSVLIDNLKLLKMTKKISTLLNFM